MTIGLFGLSRLGMRTSSRRSTRYLLVLGLGLGLVMQVLVLAVQNAVAYEVLGAATSGVTLIRGIGGSFGAAIFGTIFAPGCVASCAACSPERSARRWRAAARLTGAQVAACPPRRAAYENAYVNALHPVFVVAAAVAAVGFLLSLRLRERPLRTTASTSTGLEDALAAPKCGQLAGRDRARARIAAGAERRREFVARMAARAGVDISPGRGLGARAHQQLRGRGTLEVARSVGIAEDRIAPVQRELRERGLVEREGEQARLTPAGTAMADQLLSARREELRALLDGHDDASAPPRCRSCSSGCASS